MNPLKTITIAGTNNKYSIPVLDINDNVNIDLPEESGNDSGGISSAELENHNSSSTAHEDIRAEINELSTAINGAIVTVSVDGWAVQEDGTYTNTIVVDGVTADTTYDANLYGDYTDEQATAFGELITSIATGDGQVMVTASEAVTVELKLLLRGKIDFSEQSVVYVKDLDASQVAYDNSTSGLDAIDVQGALDEMSEDVDELNSKIGVVYQNSRVDIQMPSKTSTTLKSLTLPAGTYIVCASYCFSESFSEVCSLEVFGGQISFVPTVRGTGMYGGGLAVSFVYKSTEETTLTMSAWQGSANTVIAQSIQFDAVRIK